MPSSLRTALVALWALAAGAAHAALPIQHWQTAGGARVYFVENHDLPMLDVSVQFPAGSAYDRPEKSGVAAMTNRLLSAGADGLSEEDIAQRMADVGAVLGERFDTDRAGLSLRTLSSARERDRALDVFARILHAPTFPEAVLEREKVRVVGALRDADTRPGTIASRTFERLVFGAHPYALRDSGEVATLPGITREDIVAFHRRHYTGAQAVVALIGDVTRTEAERIAERITQGLAQADGPPPELPPVQPLEAGVTRAIAHHAQQAHVLRGAPGVRRGDPDYVALYVGNHVLGGNGLVSRISVEVRGKRGLAYSAYSYFHPLQRKGPFVIGLQTRRDQAAQALKITDRVLREFVEKGPTPEELAAAKKSIIGGFPLRFDTNREILAYLELIGFYRLPLTYLEDFVKKVEAVTLEEIRDAFRRHVDPDRLVTVVVGPELDGSRAP